jgi:hypothetical protein
MGRPSPPKCRQQRSQCHASTSISTFDQRLQHFFDIHDSKGLLGQPAIVTGERGKQSRTTSLHRRIESMSGNITATCRCESQKLIELVHEEYSFWTIAFLDLEPLQSDGFGHEREAVRMDAQNLKEALCQRLMKELKHARRFSNCT